MIYKLAFALFSILTRIAKKGINMIITINNGIVIMSETHDPSAIRVKPIYAEFLKCLYKLNFDPAGNGLDSAMATFIAITKPIIIIR